MKRLLIPTICLALISCKKPAEAVTQNSEPNPKVESASIDVKAQTQERMQGTWRSTEDSLSLVEINGDTWTFKYGKDESSSNDTYKIQLSDTISAVTKDEKAVALTLTNTDDELQYEIETLTDSVMELMYYARGNNNTYKRVK